MKIKMKKNLEAIFEVGRTWELLPKESLKEINQVFGHVFRASRFSRSRLLVVLIAIAVMILAGIYSSIYLFLFDLFVVGVLISFFMCTDTNGIVLFKEGIALYYHLRMIEEENLGDYESIERYLDLLFTENPGVQLFAMLRLDKYFAEGELYYSPEYTTKVVAMANAGVAFLTK